MVEELSNVSSLVADQLTYSRSMNREDQYFTAQTSDQAVRQITQ